MSVRGLRNSSTVRDGDFKTLKSSVVNRVPLAYAIDAVPSTPTNLTLRYPPGLREEGSLIYNQQNNTPYIRTNDGGSPVWSLLGGGGSGGGESLFETLAIGNQTGSNGVSGSATDIVMSENMVQGDLVRGTQGSLAVSDSLSGTPFVELPFGFGNVQVFGPRLTSSLTNSAPPFPGIVNGVWLYGGPSPASGDIGPSAGLIGGETPVGGTSSGGLFLFSGPPGTTADSGNVRIQSMNMPTGNTTGSTGGVDIESGVIDDPMSTGVTGSIELTSGDSQGTGPVGAVRLNGGSISNAGNPNTGGNIEINGGDTSGTSDGGYVEILGGSSNGTGGFGGPIRITGGSGSTAGGSGNGSVVVRSGTGVGNGDGGLVDIIAGDGNGTGQGGNLLLTAGNGNGTGPGGGITLTGGTSGTAGQAGIILLTTGSDPIFNGGGRAFTIENGANGTYRFDSNDNGANTVSTHLVFRQSSSLSVDNLSLLTSTTIPGNSTDTCGVIQVNVAGGDLSPNTTFARINFGQSFSGSEPVVILTESINDGNTPVGFVTANVSNSEFSLTNVNVMQDGRSLQIHYHVFSLT